MLGLSQTRFACVLNLHRNTISRYERGTHEIPQSVWDVIAGIYPEALQKMRAKWKIAKHETVREERKSYQWEKGQSRHSKQGKNRRDHQRYCNELRGLQAFRNKWSANVFTGSVCYMGFWRLAQEGMMPLLRTNTMHDRLALMAFVLAGLTVAPVIWQTLQFMRRQRLHYPVRPSLRKGQNPNAWCLDAPRRPRL